MQVAVFFFKYLLYIVYLLVLFVYINLCNNLRRYTVRDAKKYNKFYCSSLFLAIFASLIYINDEKKSYNGWPIAVFGNDGM